MVGAAKNATAMGPLKYSVQDSWVQSRVLFVFVFTHTFWCLHAQVSCGVLHQPTKA